MDARLLKIILSGDVSSFHAVLADDPLVLSKAQLSPTAETPLHMAALAGKTELVKEIIALKPDFIRAFNQDGFTPLHIASAMGNLDIVRVLLSWSFDLSLLKDEGGRTPLHYAAIKGRVDIIEELLSHCPQALEERTARGETALDLAMMNRQFDAVKLLAVKVGNGDANEVKKVKDGDVSEDWQSTMASNQLQISYSQNIEVENGTSREVPSGDQREANAAPKASQNDNWLANFEVFLGKWFKEETIMVVAALIATVTYQAGVSPPQTIWNNHLEPYEKCLFQRPFFRPRICRSEVFYEFMLFNTTGFFASVLLIFFRKPIYVWSLLFTAVLAMVATYITLCIAMAPSMLSFLFINGGGVLVVVSCLVGAALNPKYFELLSKLKRRARS